MKIAVDKKEKDKNNCAKKNPHSNKDKIII